MTNYKQATSTELDHAYTASHDITFILRHTYNISDGILQDLVSTEVIGMYYGAPSLKRTMDIANHKLTVLPTI